MALSKWYEICLVETSGGGITDTAARATLDSAKNQVTNFRQLFPHAHMIIVRQHFRNRAGRSLAHDYRVLHSLTYRRSA
jgi:hypothetical protein